MKITRLVLLLLCLTPCLLFGQKKLKKHINRFVLNEVNFKKTPGVIIGIIEGDSTYIFPFGETKRGNETLPDVNTQFELGALTKVFTATLLNKMQDEGLLRFTNPFNYYFKDKMWKDNEVTLYDIITHQSGLPRLPFDFGAKEEKGNPYGQYTFSDLMSFLETYPSFRKSNYRYSHCNYAILTKIIEQITQKTYEEAIIEHLFTPLGLENTRLNLSEDQVINLAAGYNKIGQETLPWQMMSFEGSGGLKSTMGDLLKFMRLQIDLYNRRLEYVIAKTQESQAVTPIPRIEVGLGWHLVNVKRYPYKIIGHTGATDGHQAYIGFVRETRTGVVVLANSQTELDDLGYYLLKMLNYNWRRKK